MGRQSEPDEGASPGADLPRPSSVYLAFLLVLALSVVASSGLLVGYRLLSAQSGPQAEIGQLGTLVCGTVGTGIALVLVSLLMVRIRRGSFRTDLRLGPAPARAYLLVLLGTLGFSVLAQVLIQSLGLESRSLEAFNVVLNQASFEQRLALVLPFALVAGVAEELFFRGYALEHLCRAQNPKIALVATAFLFALLHMDPVHSVFAGALGLFLGHARLHYGSIRPTVVAHVTNNSVAVLLPWATPTSHWSLGVVGGCALVAALRGLKGDRRGVLS